VDVLRGDASKAGKVLGWKTRVNLERMVDMMVEADLQRVAAGD
jgi:GDPmannose 4,6-dehydratase